MVDQDIVVYLSYILFLGHFDQNMDKVINQTKNILTINALIIFYC